MQKKCRGTEWKRVIEEIEELVGQAKGEIEKITCAYKEASGKTFDCISRFRKNEAPSQIPATKPTFELAPIKLEDMPVSQEQSRSQIVKRREKEEGVLRSFVRPFPAHKENLRQENVSKCKPKQLRKSYI